MRFNAALLAVAATLALAADGAPNGTAQILPAGEFKARDGRPGPGKFWKLEDTEGQALAELLNAIAAKTPISIDYEHQTILAATNGQPAPSAGYMTAFEWRKGAGLFAQVQWTERGRAYILAGEYRYISPVILFSKATGKITGLHNAALVSTPALLGMEAVEAALASATFTNDPTSTAQESDMDLSTLIALLGLAAGATVADVTTAIQSLVARPALPTALAAQLGLQADADEAAALSALTRLRNTPDPATLQQMTALQAQVAELRSAAAERVVAELVDGAIAAHKLAPAQREWAVNLGKADLAQLNAFINTAPAIPGLSGQLHGRTDPAAGGGDGAEEIALKAQAYQAERLAAGVHVTTHQAVNHVMAAKA
jgi:phage I-like protein